LLLVNKGIVTWGTGVIFW